MVSCGRYAIIQMILKATWVLRMTSNPIGVDIDRQIKAGYRNITPHNVKVTIMTCAFDQYTKNVNGQVDRVDDDRCQWR